MSIELKPLAAQDVDSFALEMQEAFQRSAEAAGKGTPKPVLPRADIDAALAHRGAAALVAELEGQRVGGAILFLDEASREHECAFLYVRNDLRGKGLGSALWRAVEARYPDAVAWTLCTPSFEVGNIRFYLRTCGFHIVDLFEDEPRGAQGAVGEQDFMFSFAKRLDGRWA